MNITVMDVPRERAWVVVMTRPALWVFSDDGRLYTLSYTPPAAASMNSQKADQCLPGWAVRSVGQAIQHSKNHANRLTVTKSPESSHYTSSPIPYLRYTVIFLSSTLSECRNNPFFLLLRYLLHDKSYPYLLTF
jgi:hypothetical protein